MEEIFIKTNRNSSETIEHLHDLFFFFSIILLFLVWVLKKYKRLRCKKKRVWEKQSKGHSLHIQNVLCIGRKKFYVFTIFATSDGTGCHKRQHSLKRISHHSLIFNRILENLFVSRTWNNKKGLRCKKREKKETCEQRN